YTRRATSSASTAVLPPVSPTKPTPSATPNTPVWTTSGSPPGTTAATPCTATRNGCPTPPGTSTGGSTSARAVTTRPGAAPRSTSTPTTTTAQWPARNSTAGRWRVPAPAAPTQTDQTRRGTT